MRDPFRALEIIEDHLTIEEIYQALVKSLGSDVLEDHLAFMIRVMDLTTNLNLDDEELEILKALGER
jgi:hypothetical protein